MLEKANATPFLFNTLSNRSRLIFPCVTFLKNGCHFGNESNFY